MPSSKKRIKRRITSRRKTNRRKTNRRKTNRRKTNRKQRGGSKKAFGSLSSSISKKRKDDGGGGGGGGGGASLGDRPKRVSQHPLNTYLGYSNIKVTTQPTPDIAQDMLEPLHKYFERCIKNLENLDETAQGPTEDDEYNTIDGIHLLDERPVEIKYMSSFGLENQLSIHISKTQIKALEAGGMVITGDGWRVKEGELAGEPSNEGELIIGGFNGSECHYVRIPHSLLGQIFGDQIYER